MLVAFFAVVEDAFLTGANIEILVKQTALNGILAIGMTFVILTGGIDLSVEAMVSFAGVIAAIMIAGTNVSGLMARRFRGFLPVVVDVETGGFNAATEAYEDLVKAGVIDPTKVVRTALQNAASVAGLMLTTEALVAEKPEEKKDVPAAGGGMGGMGGMDGMY